MGEASRRAKLAGGAFAQLAERFSSLGIDTSRPGFHDHPAFLAEERRDPTFLERYAEWVARRPRSAEYDQAVRSVLPGIVHRVEQRLQREGCRGTCLNASNALSRSLDRLGIWNVVLRGSLVVDPRGRSGLLPAYYPAWDSIDHPGGITGHAWLSVPPFAIVDVTARHQNRYPSDEALFALVPPVVLAEAAEVYAPDVWDCVVGEVIERYAALDGRRDARLHHRLLPGIKTMSPIFPARRVRTEEVEIRYVTTGASASEEPLERCGPVGTEGLMPAQIWEQEIRPAFEEQGVVIPAA